MDSILIIRTAKVWLVKWNDEVLSQHPDEAQAFGAGLQLASSLFAQGVIAWVGLGPSEDACV